MRNLCTGFYINAKIESTHYLKFSVLNYLKLKWSYIETTAYCYDRESFESAAANDFKSIISNVECYPHLFVDYPHFGCVFSYARFLPWNMLFVKRMQRNWVFCRWFFRKIKNLFKFIHLSLIFYPHFIPIIIYI